jgi:hypothetical protein
MVVAFLRGLRFRNPKPTEWTRPLSKHKYFPRSPKPPPIRQATQREGEIKPDDLYAGGALKALLAQHLKIARTSLRKGEASVIWRKPRDRFWVQKGLAMEGCPMEQLRATFDSGAWTSFASRETDQAHVHCQTVHRCTAIAMTKETIEIAVGIS